MEFVQRTLLILIFNSNIQLFFEYRFCPFRFYGLFLCCLVFVVVVVVVACLACTLGSRLFMPNCGWDHTNPSIMRIIWPRRVIPIKWGKKQNKTNTYYADYEFFWYVRMWAIGRNVLWPVIERFCCGAHCSVHCFRLGQAYCGANVDKNNAPNRMRLVFPTLMSYKFLAHQNSNMLSKFNQYGWRNEVTAALLPFCWIYFIPIIGLRC